MSQAGRPQHPDAALAPAARLKMARLVTDDGWSVAAAAQRFQVGPATVRKWRDRVALVEACFQAPRHRAQVAGPLPRRGPRRAREPLQPAPPQPSGSMYTNTRSKPCHTRCIAW